MEVNLPSLAELNQALQQYGQKEEKEEKVQVQSATTEIPESLRGRFSAEELIMLENKQKTTPVQDLDDYDDESEPIVSEPQFESPPPATKQLEEIKTNEQVPKQLPPKGSLVLVRKNAPIISRPSQGEESDEQEEAYEALLAAQMHQKAMKQSYELETIELQEMHKEPPPVKEEQQQQQSDQEMLFRKPTQMTNNFFD